MAPGGGGDGGRDIKFKTGIENGIAFCTLEKNVSKKFDRDLSKIETGEGMLALFCTRTISPTVKLNFVKSALEKGYRLDIFDLERLRSLLDSNLTDIRQFYLHISKDISKKIRSEIKKIVRNSDVIIRKIEVTTILETMLDDKVPLQIFDFLAGFDKEDIIGIPEKGDSVYGLFEFYAAFRRKIRSFEDTALPEIGSHVACKIREAWEIYLRYCYLRTANQHPEAIMKGGFFMNYGIKQHDMERIYHKMETEKIFVSYIRELFEEHQTLSKVARESLFNT